MKRYRHYKRDRAIVLSCFGSVIEQKKYFELKKYVEKEFDGCNIFMAFSSRMVLKKLKKELEEYKNLPQTLADVDMLGYKNIVVASINLFPTDEHQVVKSIVKGFREFSLANIRVTDAILSKTNWTTKFFKYLNSKVSKENTVNLYVIHGVPRLDILGLESVRYVSKLVEMMGGYSCSLEGEFPWCDVKEFVISHMQKSGVTNVQVVPLLLVSGNHYIKDMVEIKDELGEFFESSLAESISDDEKFNLLGIDMLKKQVADMIDEEITKLGC